MFSHGETVTVSRPGGQDRHGDPLPSAEHTIAGCALYPTSMDETAAGLSIDADWILLGPHGADIRSSDTVYRESDSDHSVSYAVQGHPWQVKHPMTGWEPGCQVWLKAQAGGLS